VFQNGNAKQLATEHSIATDLKQSNPYYDLIESKPNPNKIRFTKTNYIQQCMLM
jgi:hypothetical protein